VDTNVAIVFSEKGGDKLTAVLREQLSLVDKINQATAKSISEDNKATAVFIGNKNQQKKAAKEAATAGIVAAQVAGKTENEITAKTARKNKEIRALAEAEIAALHAKYERQKGETEIGAARRIGQEVLRIRKEFQANKIALAEEEMSAIERKNIQHEQRKLSARQAVMTTVALKNDQIANHGAGAEFGIMGVGRNIDKSFEKAGKSVLKYVGGLTALTATLGMSSAAEENAAVQTAMYGAMLMPVLGKVQAFTQAQRAAAIAQNISTAAMIKANVVFLANPITAVVAAVVALSIGFVALYNNSTTVRNGLSALWTSFKVLLGITDQSTLALKRQSAQLEKNAENARQFAEDMRLLGIRSRETSNLFDAQGQELEARVKEAQNNAANARMIAETGMTQRVTKDANGNILSMQGERVDEGTRAKMRMFAPMWDKDLERRQAELDKFNKFKPSDGKPEAAPRSSGGAKIQAGKDPLEIERDMMAAHRALMEEKRKQLLDELEKTFQAETQEQERFFAEEWERQKAQLTLRGASEQEFADAKLALETRKNGILAELAVGRDEELRRIDINQKQAEADRDIVAYNRKVKLAEDEAARLKAIAEQAAKDAEQREREEVDSWNRKANTIQDIASKLASYLAIGTNEQRSRSEEKKRYREQIQGFKGNAIERQKIEEEHQAKIAEIDRQASEQRLNMLATQVVPEIIKQLILILTASMPAAVSNSIATFGAAAATGLAAVVAAMGGFKEGGWTGDQGESEPAGFVHGREVVIKATSVRKFGRSNLEHLNEYGSLPGYRAGGYIIPYGTNITDGNPYGAPTAGGVTSSGRRNNIFTIPIGIGSDYTGFGNNAYDVTNASNWAGKGNVYGGDEQSNGLGVKTSEDPSRSYGDIYAAPFSMDVASGRGRGRITDGNPYSSLLNSSSNINRALSSSSVGPDGSLLGAVQRLGNRMDRAVDRINSIQVVADRSMIRGAANTAKGISQRKSYGRKRG
jgi:hypothetical protein